MVKVKTTVVVGLISHGIMISKQLNLVQHLDMAKHNRALCSRRHNS
jgi:hypothetical protein